MQISHDNDAREWLDLSEDIEQCLASLGWIHTDCLPIPADRDTVRRMEYRDRWSDAEKLFAAAAAAAAEAWCYSRTWPELDGYTRYTLQLRSYVAVRFVHALYTDGRDHGYTPIPFPRHAHYPKLLLWWLDPWYRSKGCDLAYQRLDAEVWSKRRSPWSPAFRECVRQSDK